MAVRGMAGGDLRRADRDVRLEEPVAMTENLRTVERYLEGFRRDDHPMILSCLTEDVEWVLPGSFHLRGTREFAREIVSEGFVPPPTIDVTRLSEASDVIYAEGFVGARRVDGTSFRLAMCDVFEMKGGKIRKLTSYIMPSGPTP
jgi:ketosteroid isomerase-like protein